MYPSLYEMIMAITTIVVPLLFLKIFAWPFAVSIVRKFNSRPRDTSLTLMNYVWAQEGTISSRLPHIKWVHSKDVNQIALNRKEIKRNVKDYGIAIQLEVNRCVQQYHQGVSQIDRSKDQWTFKRLATIKSLHSCFVKAYNYIDGASKKLSGCKNELDICLRDMAKESDRFSKDIRELNEKLTGLKASLESKEKDVNRKSSNLRSLEKELSRKREELEETTTKRNVALGVSAGMAATAIGLLVFGPASLPSLGAAAAADATAAACLVVMIALQKDITTLEKKIDSGKLECRLTSEELEKLKKDERELETKKAAIMKKKSPYLDSSKMLKQLISEVSDFLFQVKACYTVLGMIVNKFENLKDESDPDFYTNLAALKIPIRELENSMKPNMITF